MIVLQSCPLDGQMLDFIDQSIAQLAESGLEARYILVGQVAYPKLCKEISVRFNRGKGQFETYQHLPIVVDPFRKNEVCVLPQPQSTASAKGYEIPAE